MVNKAIGIVIVMIASATNKSGATHRPSEIGAVSESRREGCAMQRYCSALCSHSSAIVAKNRLILRRQSEMTFVARDHSATMSSIVTISPTAMRSINP